MTSLSQSTSVEFPKGFLWGAATAAYQIEGGAAEDGRKPSVWDTFSHVPGAVINADNGDVACDHYHRYDEDAQLMADLNLQTYRFSVSWARVRPDGVSGRAGINQKGLDFYSRLTDSLLERDILPWLTLYHWDHPDKLEEFGGWAHRDMTDLFAEYAMTVHDALGDRVKVWTTLNEPWCSAFLGYTSGMHAPGLQDKEAGLAAAHHLMLGHGKAIQLLRAADPEATLGITLNQTLPDPVNPEDPADVDAARRIDGQFNRIFLDPIFKGSYPQDILDDVAEYGLAKYILPGDLEIISTPIDALGVNYYHGELVSGHPDPAPADIPTGNAPIQRKISSPYPAGEGIYHHERGLPRTAQGWEVQPEGLTRVLKRLHDEYTSDLGVSLWITENGCAYTDIPDENGYVDDQDRLDFYDLHLRAVKDAIDDGVDVRGYFAWSLLDNFEWAWGYDKRFGIVYVDFDTQKRTPKASGEWFAQVAKTNVVPPRN